jgi:hypothetical protein
MQRSQLALRILALCVLLLSAGTAAAGPAPAPSADPAVALGNAFTYQGRLTTGGRPVTGQCDFLFALWDAASGGTRLTQYLSRTNVAVAAGLFTVSLELAPITPGAQLFAGEARWLEVQVRCPAGAGGYTALVPRQALTAAPYALYAPRAGTAQTASSVPWANLTGVPAGFLDGVDADTTYTVTAGTGLALTGNAFSLLPSYRLPQSGCQAGQVVEWGGSAWTCGTDDTGGGSGGEAAWVLTGNANIPPGSQLGTTDNNRLTLVVNNLPALRLEPTTGTANVIGGSSANTVTPGVVGATIAGGGEVAESGHGNTVTDDAGTIGGGRGNQAGDGTGPTNSARWATVAGGAFNTAGGAWSTVGGGIGNLASGTGSLVTGGLTNTVTGQAATVVGGENNLATGWHALAAGFQAEARHDGAFVWGDDTNAPIRSSAPDQFVARANGGFFLVSGTSSYSPTVDANIFLSTTTGAYLSAGGAWVPSSDRNAKANFAPTDGRAVLERLAELPIQTWNYKAESADIRHIGPTAQDFAAAFEVGADDTHIATVDADGVALAAIQGLHQVVRAQEEQIAALEGRLAALEAGSAPAARTGLPLPWLLVGGLGLLQAGALAGRAWARRAGPAGRQL